MMFSLWHAWIEFILVFLLQMYLIWLLKVPPVGPLQTSRSPLIMLLYILDYSVLIIDSVHKISHLGLQGTHGFMHMYLISFILRTSPPTLTNVFRK